MSFTYKFYATKQSTIKGSYKITAQIQTSLWSKDYEIIPTTFFTSNTNEAEFKQDIPLNITIYEDYVKKINEETGTNTQSPVLIINTRVLLGAETTTDKINEVFSPQIQIPLKTDIITIEDENLSTTQSGAIEKPEQINRPEIENKRNNWASSSLIISVVLVGFVVVTKTDRESQKSVTNQIKKIKKKYGEWLVEVDELPKRPLGAEIVYTKTLEDLIKTSEELGKPLMYYQSKVEDTHTFLVLDETMYYIFKISNKETKEIKNWLNN